MEYLRISYDNPKDRYYFQSFYDRVLTNLFDSNVVPDFMEIFWHVANPGRPEKWHCIVAVEDAAVVGGVTFEYLPNSKCCVIEYCATTAECSYITSELLQRSRECIYEEHPDTRHVFIELIPEAHHVAGGAFTEYARVVDFDYVTPPVREGAAPVTNMLLNVLYDPSPIIGGEDVKKFLIEYFKSSFICDNVYNYVPDLPGEVGLLKYDYD